LILMAREGHPCSTGPPRAGSSACSLQSRIAH
jgi:hypothetical protein